MIRVNVSLANATVTETETLTAGRVGLECGFTFSSEWDGLAKVAVFEGAETIEVALGTASIAVVPPECMATAGYNLRVGVYGLSPSEAVVIPTVWAKAGKIKDSAAPDDESFAPATPELVAQIIEKSDTALSIAQNVAVQAASGAFDGAPGVSPTVESEEITGGHRITITDVTGDTVVDVMDGADGRNGTDGINGTDGSDGVSPEVTITSITGGHRVSITDADHPSGQSFDVMDGASAYEQAVSGGYTGDEEQFNTDLANFKTYAAQTASDATAAEDSATAAGNAQTAAETAQEAAEDAQEAAETAQAAAETAAEQAETYAAGYFKAFPTDTASGPVASFPDGADDFPVKDLTVAIEPVQSGTGVPAPDNVRPISGRTGAIIHVSPTADAEDGTTYAIAFPAAAGTVYGGTLDVTTGKLTVDRAIVTPTGLKAGTYVASNVHYPWVDIPLTAIAYSDSLCNKLRCVTSYGDFAANISFMVRDSFITMNLSGTGYSTRDDAIAAGAAFIQAGDVQFCYELATPIAYDLTPTEVTTLLGTNIIWADCGDSTVEYRADTKLYIDKKIASIPTAQGVSF